jgi:MFS family permease
MKLFKEGELKLLWPFYLDALISPMFFFMPAFMIVYFRDLNFSLFQIAILTSIMGLTRLIFEIPTGAIADLYGRKFSVLFGESILALSLLSLMFFKEYYLIIICFILIGFGETFISGAKEAWVSDLVKKEKKNLLQSYFMKSQSIDSFGILISGILGAIVVKNYGISYIWLFSFLSYCIAVCIKIFAQEKFIKKKFNFKKSLKEIKEKSIVSFKYAKNHHVIFYFFIAVSLLVIGNALCGNIAWITLLQELNFPTHYFGYMWSVMGAVGIFAPIISSKLVKKNEEKKFLINIIIIMGLFLLLIIFVKNYYSALAILFGSIFLYFLYAPIERVYFQKFLVSKYRATVGSIESMLLSLIGIIIFPIVGLLIDNIGAKYTILSSSIFFIMAGIVYFRIKEKKK